MQQDVPGAGPEPEATEGVLALTISVDARGSGDLADGAKPRMREQIYRIVRGAFAYARIDASSMHLEDRGDGVLVVLEGTPPVRLLGLWLLEVHERLRAENAGLAHPLGLRVGMNVGMVRRDAEGVSGRSVDLACRLGGCDTARALLDRDRTNLVLVVSDRLYHDAVSPGGRFVDPDQYVPAVVQLKEGPVTAWFTLPGQALPQLADEALSSDVARDPVEGSATDASAKVGTDEPADEAPAQQPSFSVTDGDVTFIDRSEFQGPTHIGRTVKHGGGRG